MKIVLWVMQGLVALAMAFTGTLKLISSKADLVAGGMGAFESYPPLAIKGIGALEVAAALGLILPALTKILPVLTPLAATGVALLMVGAIVVHLTRGEAGALGLPVLLLILSGVIAWGRFGPYAVAPRTA